MNINDHFHHPTSFAVVSCDNCGCSRTEKNWPMLMKVAHKEGWRSKPFKHVDIMSDVEFYCPTCAPEFVTSPSSK